MSLECTCRKQKWRWRCGAVRCGEMLLYSPVQTDTVLSSCDTFKKRASGDGYELYVHHFQAYGRQNIFILFANCLSLQIDYWLIGWQRYQSQMQFPVTRCAIYVSPNSCVYLIDWEKKTFNNLEHSLIAVVHLCGGATAVLNRLLSGGACEISIFSQQGWLQLQPL